MGQLDILHLLRDEPFKPFRLRLADESYFDVRHLGMLIPTPTSIFIGVPDPNSPNGAAAKVKIAPLSHVVKIEYLN